MSCALWNRTLKFLFPALAMETRIIKGTMSISLDRGYIVKQSSKPIINCLFLTLLKMRTGKNNPDIKLNMISYLGFPLVLPDGEPFGTICVLDSKENAYSDLHESLLEKFRSIIQSHLDLIYMNAELGEKYKSISDILAEMKTLRGILPICAVCKNIRDSEGNWHRLEEYISDRSEASFSHGCCPICAKKLYGLES